MNSQNPNGWAPGSGPGPPPPPPPGNEQVSMQQRQSVNFGPNIPLPQASQINGSSNLQPSGPFFSSQQNGHNLPNPQNLHQASAFSRGPPQAQQQQQHSPPSLHIPAVPAPSYNVAALGPSMQTQDSPQAMSEREYHDRDRVLREQHIRQELIARDRYDQEHEIVNRQREQQVREELTRDQHAREQAREQQQQLENHQSQLENHTGAITIQQPVASRVPATLHGPNGILNDQNPAGAAPQPQPTITLGAPSGPGNVFSNGVQTSNEASLRPFAQQATQTMPSQQMLGFTHAANPQQLPNGGTHVSQGQQPILNDALSYLDQVKVRFVDQPDVYNKFLDIMKDFKSQSIDTPGVIERVSTLFTGHPELIQGFNTFLPPGYRIECGTRDDPNAIRVTTPMGTTVSQMPSVHNRLNGGFRDLSAGEQGRQAFYVEGQSNGEWVPQQHDIDNGEDAFSARQGGLGLFANQAHIATENGMPYEREDQGVTSDAALIAHQQEQRGVSHLSNAVSAVATNGQARPGLAQVSPGAASTAVQGVQPLSNSQQQLLGMGMGIEKRGPVEFNHAIGYVNKIKNRFATSPEIYKQFLEILQTYQRESKPIQDVYAQVTQLFSSAPDLLEDFKQFLPESAAQAKAQAAAQKQATEDAAILSNVRGDANFGSLSQHTQIQTPRPEMKMPPVGNFAPPSVGKENKKRRGGAGSHMAVGPSAMDNGAGSSRSRNLGGTAKQRSKVEPPKPAVPEVAPVSPNLVPALPTPMPPTRDIESSSEMMTFFDRVKKYLANKQTFTEFLKLCNLFTQDLIEKNTLMHKAHAFIGANGELISYFKDFIQYDGRDEIVENEPKLPGDKVVLSNCRGLGPSYRLLPKRERLRLCSGRDEMCREVLNDEWVSHPTWASEDSGFVAHRKNAFEEALHRIEEERHDYDINIEACLRTIQLMEPIAQQLKMMSDVERLSYNLPPGIGGQSETIYQRVIKKMYDRERGAKVIDDLFKRPSCVLPILLGRLKQKSEEWKAGQREWEKVWREQTNKIFWKSLDHQGIAVKAADKRQFQPKVLQTEIQVRYEEQRRQKIVSWNNVPKYQFKYIFDDLRVIQDACHLILTHLQNNFICNDADKSRLETFIKTFIPTFFDLDRDDFDQNMQDVDSATPENEEAEDEATADEDNTTTRGRRTANGKKSNANLLRGVLDRAKQGQKEESASNSKETTPDVQSNDEDAAASTGTPTDNPRVDPSEHRWMAHPMTGNNTANLNLPFQRDDFHLYASVNIYCFFRMFQTLYERLCNIKAHEQHVHDDIRNAKMTKAAHELKLVDKLPTDYFQDVGHDANFYQQVLQMCEDVLKQDVEPSQLEETLRRFYMQNGWQLYSFEKMLGQILKYGLQILVSDNKDKSLDIINLFYKDRKEDETTHAAELTYRKQVEKLTKEGDIYRIRYTRSTKTTTLQIFKKDEKTYEADELAAHARWSYYVSTFSMLDRTEGVPLSKLNLPYLHRNVPAKLENADDYETEYAPLWNQDGLVIRISPNNYHMLYDPGTCDWWMQSVAMRKKGLGAYEEVKKARGEGVRGLFEDRERNAWMRGLGDEEVREVKERFERWIRDGPDARDKPPVDAEEKMGEEAEEGASPGAHTDADATVSAA